MVTLRPSFGKDFSIFQILPIMTLLFADFLPSKMWVMKEMLRSNCLKNQEANCFKEGFHCF